MKKTLLAAALIAGYAGAASAQNSVTLYGVIDMGFAYQSAKAGKGERFGEQAGRTFNQVAMASGQQSGSRWGLRGVEDLGGGLRANFVYEAGVTANTGAAGSFNRVSTVGLSSSSWGSVDLGRTTSSGTWAFSGIDPFGAGFGQAALTSSAGAQFVRLSNLVRYVSPSFSGFAMSAGYSFDNGLRVANGGEAGTFGTTNKFRTITTGVRYTNGPLLLAGMFDSYLQPSAQGKAVKQWNIGGTYDFKIAKVAASYGQNIDGVVQPTATLANAGISGGDTNTTGGVLYRKGGRTQQWMIGVTAPLGQGSLFASFQQKIPGGDFSGGSTQSTGSVGYSYSLSQRTNVYAYYSYMDNAAMVKGTSAQTLGVGVRHLF